MPQRKPLAGQRGFSFFPPESEGTTVKKGEKIRCMGPSCIRKDYQGVVLPASEFPKTKKNKNRLCKICTAEAKMLKQYNISLEAFEAQLLAQHNVCALCKSQKTRNQPLLIDYHLKTGKMKGLLCKDCQRKWNQFEWIVDHPEWIEAAMIYREKTGGI